MAAVRPAQDSCHPGMRAAAPAGRRPREIVLDLAGLSYTVRVWTGAEWTALPPGERPGAAYLMSDGESYCLARLNPVLAGSRLLGAGA